MEIICCNKKIELVEEGVNESDFYVCPICKKTYNIIEGIDKE